MSDQKYRLVTRSDFDGLACAVILKHLGILDEILFVHPKDMQDGKVAVTARDITTNVPYVPGVHLAFDHHLSETLRVGKKDNHVIDALRYMLEGLRRAVRPSQPAKSGNPPDLWGRAKREESSWKTA